jgi:hypothetical protein
VRRLEPSGLSPRLLAWADGHRRAILFLVPALYLLAFNGQWRLDADSALYLTIGRNLAEGRGYTYHGQHHTLAYPGMPWLFAGLFKAFGADTVWPHDVVMLACGLATLGLVYRLFLLHAGRPTAVLMTAVVGLSRMFFRYSFELLSDMPFLMGVTAFLAGCEALFHAPRDRGYRPRWYDAALLAGGLAVAVVTRPTMWALVAAVVVVLALSLFKRPPRRAWLAVGAACVAAAGVVVVMLFHRLGGDYERVFLDTLNNPGEVTRVMLSRNLPELLHPGAAEAVFGFDLGGVAIGPVWLTMGTVPSLLLLGAGVALARRRLLWGVWVAMSALMMLVTLVEVRYFLQVLPLLLYGCWLLLSWLDRRLAGRGRWLPALPVGLFVAIVAVNAGRAVTLVVEQRGVPFLKSYRHGKYALVPELTRLLQSQTPPDAWVLVPERQLGRILTFTSRRYAVEPGPVTQLNPEIQTVYVLEPLEEDSLRWMGILRLGVGDPVGPSVKGGRGKEWRLHHAVKLPPATARVVPTSAATRHIPAPEGRKTIAHGASRGDEPEPPSSPSSFLHSEPRRGERIVGQRTGHVTEIGGRFLRPSGAGGEGRDASTAAVDPRLTSWAKGLRPSGAKTDDAPTIRDGETSARGAPAL